MSRLRDYLEHSRIARVIEQVEAGEPVDLERVAIQQSLDVARIGELFALDVIESEDAADEQFRQQLDQQQ